jgi:tetrahydromethanopterin S-methyltransferase subunit F
LDIKKCKNTIKMRSKFACPNSNIYAVSNAIKKNSILFGFILILFGFYLTFISYKYSSLTQILIGVFVVLFIAIYFILIKFDPDLFYRQKELLIWIVVFFVIGIGIGLLFANSMVVCSATLGGFTGYFLTQILMQSIVVLLTRYSYIIYYVLIIILFSFLVFLGIRFKKHFFIIFSCFIGSYAIVRVIYFF